MVKMLVFERGVGHFERKFQEEWGRPSTSSWAITWCCSRDPTFSRFDTIPAFDTHTDRQTDRHAMMANIRTRAELAPHR